MKRKIIIVYIVLILIVIASQIYKIHYNYGNMLYKKREFYRAINEYRKALDWNPLHNKQCSVRINLALSMIANINENSSLQDIIVELQEARKVLCEEGCANENNNLGHNSTAEQLKSDIDKMLKELQNSNVQENNEKDKPDDEKKESKPNTDKVQEQLEKIQEDARKSRQEGLEYIRSSEDYEYYSGKNW